MKMYLNISLHSSAFCNVLSHPMYMSSISCLEVMSKKHWNAIAFFIFSAVSLHYEKILWWRSAWIHAAQPCCVHPSKRHSIQRCILNPWQIQNAWSWVLTYSFKWETYVTLPFHFVIWSCTQIDTKILGGRANGTTWMFYMFAWFLVNRITLMP